MEPRHYANREAESVRRHQEEWQQLRQEHALAESLSAGNSQPELVEGDVAMLVEAVDGEGAREVLEVTGGGGEEL